MRNQQSHSCHGRSFSYFHKHTNLGKWSWALFRGPQVQEGLATTPKKGLTNKAQTQIAWPEIYCCQAAGLSGAQAAEKNPKTPKAPTTGIFGIIFLGAGPQGPPPKI
jgi:hypothetical protein